MVLGPTEEPKAEVEEGKEAPRGSEENTSKRQLFG